jgi:outer membrane protein TolC
VDPGGTTEPVAQPQPAPTGDTIRRVAYETPVDSLATAGELSLSQLVEEVQRQNPSIEAAIQAWHAAAERYPQAISLEDPMFEFLQTLGSTSTMMNPMGIGMGQEYEATQKIPWFGKRRLRGEAATAQAHAAYHDVLDTRLRITEAAQIAFSDYYQAQRQLEVNTENVKLLHEFREIARVRYEAQKVPLQDVIQADLEIARLGTREAELDQSKQVAAARINTLLHRAARHPLPPPPAKLSIPGDAPTVEVLQAFAIERRPDLAAQSARIREEEANLALACKDYYPDPTIVFKSMSGMGSELGFDVNVPIYQQKRNAAVREMTNRLSQGRAEYQQMLDQTAFEVETAWQRVNEQRRVVNLFESKILSLAQTNIESARASYSAGQADFLRLIDAERQLREQQDRYHEAVAEYQRRTAGLERAIGGGHAETRMVITPPAGFAPAEQKIDH